MRKTAVIVVLIAAAAAAFGAIWHLRATKETAQAPGAEAPRAAQSSVSKPVSPARDAPFFAADGTAHTLAAFAGRPVLVNFWATWCGPCKDEMPALDRLAQRMAPKGLAVIALSQDLKGWDKIGPFLATLDLKALPVYFDKGGRVARSLGVAALPTTYLLGPDGKPVGRFVGEVDWDSERAEKMLRKYALGDD